MSVYIGQFTKGQHCSEHDALVRFDDLITIQQFGEVGFIRGKPSDEDIAKAKQGFAAAQKAVLSGEYSVVILDEINIATHYKMISVDEVLLLIDSKPQGTELILTGRNADSRIMERADLVTEMQEIKHYYKQGVPARTGIEK